MNVNRTQLVPRKPRHEISSKCEFHVELDSPRGLDAVDCSLIDLSRNGFKAWTASPLDEGVRVRVRLRLEQIGFDTPLGAIVRWTDAMPGGDAVSGFLFEDQVPLEVIGELILLGVIRN